MSSVSEWRDNLLIGIYLASQPFGASLYQVLVNALGYNPGAPYPQNMQDTYLRRFRRAQRLGEDKYVSRVPGYFTIKAQPFGNIFVYRTLWYIWVNPTSRTSQAVLIGETDVSAIRRFNDGYLATRSQTARNVRTAHQVLRNRAALGAGDVAGAYAIQSEMTTDGTLGELLTNQLGLPYAEFAPVLDQLGDGSRISIRFNFNKTARRIRRLERELQQEQARIVTLLSTWINIKTGLPANARSLALADAQSRLAKLP
jgi:hypothetical protein